MGNSYTRQSAADIVAGLEIQAGPLNAEFNQLQSAFDASAGHSHDGSTGEGPKISLTTSIQGILPIVNGGFGGIHNLTATTAPLSTDDNLEGYVVGSIWIDTTANVFYVCVDSSTGAAIWNRSQDYNTNLSAIAGLTSAANKGITFSGVGTAATYDLSTFALTLLDDTTQVAAQTTLGLVPGTNVFTQRTITAPAAGITVSNGDGVSGNPTLALSNDLAALEALSGTDIIYYRSGVDTWTAVTIGTNLGFSGGVLSNTYSAASLDADLQAIAALSGTGFAVRTAADTWALRTITGTANQVTVANGDGVSGNPTLALPQDIATSSSPQFAGVNVGNATDTTIGRTSAGVINVEGKDLYMVGGADVAVSDGGTGASTSSSARTNLGLAIGTDVEAHNSKLTNFAALSDASGVLKNDGAGNYSWASGGKGVDVILEDQKASGTNAGTFTSGADQTRTLNTKVYDPNSYCTLSSNQFTLPAGTWYISWSAPAFGCNGHQTLIHNVTDSADVARGEVGYSNTTGAASSPSVGGTVATIAASKTFELRHRCTTTSANNGLGVACGFGTEVYARVEITKVA